MGFNPTVVAYALCRPAAILFGLLAIIAKSPNTTNCQSLMLGEFTVCFVAMTTSSFLFLRRVQAIWKGNKIVEIGFTLIWLTGVALDALLFDVTHAGPLADTGYCVVTSLKGTLAAGAPIVSLCFDTLVLLSVSYKLVTEYQATEREGAGTRVPWVVLMSGKGLSRLARSILRGGQQYYLIAVIANLFLVVFMWSPLTSFELAVAPTPVAIIIISASACRVFRDLKLSTMTTTEVFDTDKSIRFELPVHNAVRYHNGVRRGQDSSFLSSSTGPTASGTQTVDNLGAPSTILELQHIESSLSLEQKTDKKESISTIFD
ncbi:hypothetical protein NP233_g7005 [Leucocoprinus birnbaumii]|uniref:Uncharacterized protein n=1 Tax=Leucocoprinus birnbaumii TaxID=56174 RepID=A0AAD5VSR4_9AGAR|nr:hypothetical protein NP233_g7005 [Leucocoprinus birnbaumii]